MAKTNVFALAIGLTEADAIALAESIGNEGSVESRLSMLASSVLRGLAKGGAHLPPEWTARIQAAIGTTDPSAIVEHVERAVGRAGEATRIEWIVDPTQINFYQQLADNAGTTLPRQLKSLMDYAYENGWFGMGAPDVCKLLLEPAEYRQLQQFFGKDIVTGSDVIGALTSGATLPVDCDPVLESLRGE